MTVTTARAVFRQETTYAMANITSVREFVQPRPVPVALLGSALVTVGLLCVNAHVADSADVGWILVPLGLLAFAVFLLAKPKYWVRIGTAGAETNAIWSHDPRWTRAVVAAINGAIVSRG